MTRGGPTGPFEQADRLLRRREFQYVNQRARRAAFPAFVVLSAPRPDGKDAPRLGLTMSRRVGNAVLRNHLKRRVREWFRRERAQLRPGNDIVVIGRSAAKGRPTAELWETLDRAASELGLVS